MKRVTLIATALLLTILAVLSSRVTAQETNTRERTFLTFSGDVEMPGVTLPAGTYVFKLADTDSRNVVQVFDKDEKQILGQWLFVQAERPQVTSDNVVMFKETREGGTPAIQFWYFPGEKIGKEFIYPKDQATKIAARTNGRVLTSAGSSVSSVDAQGNVTEWKREEPTQSAANQSAESTLRNAPAPAEPSAPAGSLTGNRGANEPPAEAAQAAPQPSIGRPAQGAVGTSGSASQASTDSATAQSARSSELPRTASPLPLSGLIGLLSLAGAMGLRVFRQ